jgi:penicillin-binding protein 2
LRQRVYLLGAVFLAGLFVLATNLYRLMVIRYDEFLALSTDNEFKDVRIRAARGLIRDRRGEVLVDARPSLDVFVTPAFCTKCAVDVLPRLGKLLKWDTEQQQKVENLLKEARGPQRYQQLQVQVDLSRDQFDRVNAQLFSLPGVDLEAVPHRHYRTGTALSHVLGHMNEINKNELSRLNEASHDERPAYAMGDYIGRRGLERSFESVLRGSDGWLKEVVNARGEVMRDERGKVIKRDEVSPRPGHNLILSIDARLQAEAERAFPGTAGAVVVLETKTGFVLTMLSRPGFDPNEMTGRVSPARVQQIARDPLKPMIFRAGAEHYHPGSTFKVVPLLAALQSGQINTETTVTCGGGYQLGARRWRCHKDSGHGPVQLRHAIQWSCDTFFYKVADMLGVDPIAKVGRDLGLGAITHLGVVGEVPGVMPDSAYHDRVTPGGYTKGMALNTAIGQGDVNVTPLQLAVLYSAIGNGGKVLQPQVVQRIETADGDRVQEFSPKLTRQVNISREHQRLVIDALTAVVNEPGGTAYRTRLADVRVAGKTGTAQVARLGQVRLKTHQMRYFERDHAWFAAFAPAVDPEITIVVLNEHGGHGGSDAAPTAAAIFRKYFELKQIDGNAFDPERQPNDQRDGGARATSAVMEQLARVRPSVVPDASVPSPLMTVDGGSVAVSGETVDGGEAEPSPGDPAEPPADEPPEGD